MTPIVNLKRMGFFQVNWVTQQKAHHPVNTQNNDPPHARHHHPVRWNGGQDAEVQALQRHREGGSPGGKQKENEELGVWLGFIELV